MISGFDNIQLMKKIYINVILPLLNCINYYFRFPSNKIMLQKWHDFITRNNINLQNINKNRVICSSHFSPESFIIHKKSKVLLRHAIPNIMISRVKRVSESLLIYLLKVVL